ncbi:peptidoglycan DD-metalloendopeptidase family protein [Leptolyngbyaceae cyanobacterium UHCC 1019]
MISAQPAPPPAIYESGKTADVAVLKEPAPKSSPMIGAPKEADPTVEGLATPSTVEPEIEQHIEPTKTSVQADQPVQTPETVFTQAIQTGRQQIGKQELKAKPESTEKTENTSQLSNPDLATDSTQSETKSEQQKALEQQLIDVLDQENEDKAERLKQYLVVATLHYAETGKFELARKTAQNPLLSVDIQTELLQRIDEIEAETIQVSLNPTEASQSTLSQEDQPTANKTANFSITNKASIPLQPSSHQLPAPRRGDRRALTISPSAPTRTLSNQEFFPAPIVKQSPSHPPLVRSNLRLIFPLAVAASTTSSFGWRVHPISSESRFHAGIDFGAPMGATVIAAHSGQVVAAQWQGGYGLAIALRHKDGTEETLYAHLSEIFVQSGQWVEQGQPIGAVGSTGNSTGPHLHFEVRQNTAEGWVAVDPATQLNQAIPVAHVSRNRFTHFNIQQLNHRRRNLAFAKALTIGTPRHTPILPTDDRSKKDQKTSLDHTTLIELYAHLSSNSSQGNSSNSLIADKPKFKWSLYPFLAMLIPTATDRPPDKVSVLFTTFLMNIIRVIGLDLDPAK